MRSSTPRGWLVAWAVLVLALWSAGCVTCTRACLLCTADCCTDCLVDSTGGCAGACCSATLDACGLNLRCGRDLDRCLSQVRVRGGGQPLRPVRTGGGAEFERPGAGPVTAGPMRF